MEAKTVLKNSSLVAQDKITLGYEQRCKRRCTLTTDAGLEFLLNLPHAGLLNQGDMIELNNGTLVLVQAAAEDVLDIKIENLSLGMHLTWSLGNMHRPIEIRDQGIRVRYDYLLENEYKNLKIPFIRHQAPFSPKNIDEFL